MGGAVTERCDLTELPVTDCAHCRDHTEETKDRASVTVGQPFTANHPGRCGGCDEPIHVGDEIARAAESSGYLCKECRS